MHNDHSWDPKIVAVPSWQVDVVQRFPYLSKFKMGSQNGGRYMDVVVSSGLIVYNNWMIEYLSATVGGWMSLVIGASVVAFLELNYFVSILFIEFVCKKNVLKS